MKGILGVKLGMTQVIEDNGVVTPVTIVQAGPCYVAQIKTVENDGYTAVQLGFGETREKSLTRGQKGHLGLLKNTHRKSTRTLVPLRPLRYLREFRVDNVENYELGQVLTADLFAVGDKIDVTGTSKGRGFAGTVKRHGFRGGPKTHGQSDRWRAPGSIGATSSTARVFKGTRMSGHMGNVRQTIQNLEVVRIDPERNLLAVKGSIPGTKGGFVIIRQAVKKS